MQSDVFELSIAGWHSSQRLLLRLDHSSNQRTGIGHNIETWGENFMMKPLLAGVLLLSLTAILVNEAIRWVERKCGAWRT